MLYITREEALEIITRMQKFETCLGNLFADFEYDLHENLGRRNILLSNVQEKETARVLRNKFETVISNGFPGQPDVVIKDINKELECKLTSGSNSNGNVSYALQTDWETICNKGKLDYNYILVNEDFTQFAYIIFEGLTSEDFFPPAAGSRGKSRMRKETAMKKARVLVGNVINNSEIHIQNIENKIKEKIQEKETRLKTLSDKIEAIQNKETKKYEKAVSIYENEKIRFRKSIDKLFSKRKAWEDNSSFSFVLEDINR